MRFRRKDLTEVLAARAIDLDGDLIDLTWQACARQDLEWIGDTQLTERTDSDIAEQSRLRPV